MPERTILKRFVRVFANYRTLPTGTAITFKKSVNHGAYGDNLETVVDAKRKTVYTKIAIEDASTMQIRVATTASSNNAPEIENIEIDF
jgi:hypothetical protein